MRTFTRTAQGLIAIPLLFSMTPALGGPNYSTIALSGRQADQTPPGTTFAPPKNIFDGCRPRIDDAGNVIFTATLAGNGLDFTNNRGIWTGRANALHLLARSGEPAAGTEDGTVYYGIDCNPRINGNGYSTFFTSLNGPNINAANDIGIWSGYGLNVYLLVRKNSPLPGLDPPEAHGPVFGPVVSSSGAFAFAAQVTFHDDNGLWKGTPGSLELIARTDPAFVGYNQMAFRVIASPSINSAGDTIYTASLPSYTGTWKQSASGTELLWREGLQVPGMPPGIVFGGYTLPAFSDAEVIAFMGSFHQDGILLENDTGIWAGPAGAIQLVAREGAQAPDAPTGVNMGQIFYLPVLNKRGDVAFRGFLDGGGFSGGDMGLWAGPYSDPKLLITSQTVATTTARGEIYFKFFIADPNLNNNGDIAFYALLQGPGVSTANDHSLWVRSHEGDLILIAQEGSPFAVGGGEMRIVKELGDYDRGGSDPTLGDSFFNDAGQLVFELSFTDGSAGIFVATVPEPVSFTLMIFLACLARRRMPMLFPTAPHRLYTGISGIS
jgi:hypothetical protein